VGANQYNYRTDAAPGHTLEVVAMNLYGQYCPVARATELLADRWTLLIVRELLADIRRFNDLDRAGCWSSAFAAWSRQASSSAAQARPDGRSSTG
jgi:hypothetical protein